MAGFTPSPRIALVVLILSATVTAQTAQPPSDTGLAELASRLPEGVLGFVATSGGDRLKPAFEQSHVGQLWSEPSVQTFYRQIKDAVWAKIQTDPQVPQEDRQKIEEFLELAKTVLMRPAVIGVAVHPGPIVDPKKAIYPFLVIDAGPRRADLEVPIGKLTDKMARDQLTRQRQIGQITLNEVGTTDQAVVNWGWVGDRFVLTINDPQGAVVQKLAEEVSADSPFADAIRQEPGDEKVFAIFADFQRIGATVAQAVAAEDPNAAVEFVPKARQMLGTLGLVRTGTMNILSGFDGQRLVTSLLLETPEPRTGLLAAFRQIDPARLDVVPPDATSASIDDLDLGKLYDTIMKTVMAADEQALHQLMAQIAGAQEQLGFRIRQGLVESISGPFVYFDVPPMQMVEAPAGGAVVIAGLKDTEVFQQAIQKLTGLIMQQAQGYAQATTQPAGERVMNVIVIPQLALLQLSPTWTIVDNQLVVATNPSLCTLAIRRLTAENPESVRTTEAYKQVMVDLPEGLIALRFINTQRQWSQALTMLQQFWPMMAMGAQQQAQITLPMMLPPAQDILKHMAPSLDYSWLDAQGLRSRTIGAFGGGSSPLSLVAVAGVGTAVALPALSRARETARRSVSMSNLRQIGIAMMMYANDFEDQLPPDLEALVANRYVTKEVFSSPLKPEAFDGPSYVYTGPRKLSEVPDVTHEILAHENPAYLSEGTNVLFADSHVEWMKPDEFRQRLQATYERLGKPMPEIQFGQTGRKSGFDLGEFLEDLNLPFGSKSRSRSSAVDRMIPFKCTACGAVVMKNLDELQQMHETEKMAPMMSSMKLVCPKCDNKELTQAVLCLKCDEVFIFEMDPMAGADFDDRCPKCGVSYAEAWQEKYGKGK
ncbi:MAG: DUF1559 domain-containing protein [Phycisphaerae bacterium]|nr:DUF1559 domain-containing protein [Phycisphaerae bacterium]